MEKITYKVDDQERYLVVKKPDARVLTRSQIEASKLFADLVNSGNCILRTQLDEYMERIGLWSEEKQKKLEEKQNHLKDLIRKIKAGGITLTEGRKTAIDIKKARSDINSFLAKRTQLDNNTIEGQCDNLKIDFIISQCIFDEEGKRVFKGVDDYRDNNEEHVIKATNKLVSWIYGIDEDIEKKLPENQFLLKYGFVNEDLQFIDKEGRLTDIDGRLIDDEGRYINEDGEYVDADGNRVDEDGELIIEFTPFIEE